MYIECPECGNSMEVSANLTGKKGRCPECGTVFTVRESQEKADDPSLPPDNTSAIEPGDEKSSETKRCPFCGEEILARARKCKHCGEFLNEREGDAGGGPVGNHTSTGDAQKVNSQSEKLVWKGHPSHLCYIVAYFFGGIYILGIITVLLGGIYILGGITAPLGLMIIVWAFLDQRYRIYTLTTKRVTMKNGILSRQTEEIMLDDIRNIVMKQGIIERLLGIGSVEIACAGTAAVEMKFRGVVDPDGLKSKIAQQRDAV